MDNDEAKDVAKSLDAMIPIVRARLIEARTEIAKAEVEKGIGEPDASTRSMQVSRDDFATAFTNLGALDPLYDPEMLALLFEHSNSLRQNVDAYATNIDAFGHRFDPIFDLDASDIDNRIADAMRSDRERELDDEDAEPAEPTPEEVKKMKDRLRRVMRVEKTKLHHFFEFCSPDTSFVTLRSRTRQDLEVMGNAYWEVLRNRDGEVVQFVYVAGFTIRLLPLDLTTTTVKHRIRVSELSYDDIEIPVRFRRYVQIVEGRSVFFKEFGDPRVISAKTGVAHESVESMVAAEGGAAMSATELMHFRVYSPRSAYGVPRWIGNLLAVIGSRQAEEVNFNYFENKSVPPLAILVSGGRMSNESVTRVTDYVEANIKGKRNFHKILVLEADGGADASSAKDAARMKIDIKPLTGAQHTDALFQNYDERNIDKVGQSFRLPRMLRGDIRDFNRSTADAALTFAEMQVFQPVRQEFDFIVNRKILPTLGIRYWRFTSLAPVMRDPTTMSEAVRNLVNANVLTPEEARDLAGDVFNREFKKLQVKWVKQPPAFTLAGIAVEEEGKPRSGAMDDENFDENEDSKTPTEPEGIQARLRARRARKAIRKAMASDAGRLILLREALRAGESEEWIADLRKHHAMAG